MLTSPTGKTVAVAAVALTLAALISIAPVSPLTLQYQLRELAQRAPLPTSRPNLGIGTIGHRSTLSAAPEHTRPGIDEIIAKGFDYVELDVRVTRDGVPVILHDKTLDRTTNGSGQVHQMDWSDVQQLDAGSWFAPEFAGERVLSLEAALQHLQGRACVMWDTKAFPTARMVALFKRYGFDRECLLITFGGFGSGGDERVVQRLLNLWPDAPIMPQVREPTDIATVVQRYPQSRGIYALWGYVTPELVDTAHAQGLLVVSGTLNQHDTEGPHRYLLDAGADYFMLANKADFESLRASLDAAQSN